MPELVFSVSATTRDPRPGEVDGKDYRFTSRDEFQRMIESGELLEWAEIHGGLQLSGTPAAPVRRAIEQGKPVLVERLTGRGTESAEVVERRLATARVELEAQDEFDEVIVNEDVSRSCDELVSLLVGRPEQSESTH
jgi:guanylate kinase